MKPASYQGRAVQTWWRIRGAWMAMFCFTVSCGALKARAFTSADADTLLQAHTKAFYRVKDGRASFKETTEGGKASYWMRAEQMEMVLDAYERTTNAVQLVMFTNLFRGFLADHGTNWAHNEYNDDIMWMVIACTRAHLLTGNPEFRDVARTNFDLCYARAVSTDLGGGLWWKVDNRSKNACVNGPGAIAAFLLGRATGERAYFTTATNLFLWERATLYDPATGRVSDNINLSGRVRRMALTYNQGTFVGAANLLGYTNEARLAATFTMKQLCQDGYLPAAGENGDGGGFNGIGVRWIARFMKERGEQATFEPWLQKNAEAAWQARRSSDNLTWCRWPQPTPPGPRYSWGCSSAVVIMQVVRPPETTAGWEKYESNPIIGGKYGTCFDISVLRDGDRYRMWLSWRPKQSVALLESQDGIHWSEPPRIVLGPRRETGWEDDINRPVVLKREDGYHLWYTGQAKGHSAIGYATSPDGVVWKRLSDRPVLSPEKPWEKAAVMCPHVLWDAQAGLFRLWYSGGEQNEPNAIGYATSPDGLHWAKHPANPIFTPDPTLAWEQHKVTACQVERRGEWYVMFYIGFRDEPQAQIGIARSRDGTTNWQRHPANPIIRPGKDRWDHDACYKPYAIFDGRQWLLWYNGRHGGLEQIGVALHAGEDLGFP